MLNLFFLLFIICTVSCEKENSIVIETNSTVVTELPIQIDTSLYDSILSQFQYLENITIPSWIEDQNEYLAAIKTQYKTSLFQMIPPYYGGLSPKYPMLIVKEIYGEPVDCLTKEGGHNVYCENLIIEKNNQFIKVNSLDQFQELFSPIENEQEALSYVNRYLDNRILYEHDLEGNYEFYVNSLPVSNVARLDSGYITTTFLRAQFGCHTHPTIVQKHFLDINGNITFLDEKLLYEHKIEFCKD